ncbi:hypothetical protein COBT_001483 [Conglomerata obtusa]
MILIKCKKNLYRFILISIITESLYLRLFLFKTIRTTTRLQKKKEQMLIRDIAKTDKIETVNRYAKNEHEERIKNTYIENEPNIFVTKQDYRYQMHNEKNSDMCAFGSMICIVCYDIESDFHHISLNDLTHSLCKDHIKQYMACAETVRNMKYDLDINFFGVTSNNNEKYSGDMPQRISTKIDDNNTHKYITPSNIAIIKSPGVNAELSTKTFRLLKDNALIQKLNNNEIKCEFCYKSIRSKKRAICKNHTKNIYRTFRGARKLLSHNIKRNNIEKIELRANLMEIKLNSLKINSNNFTNIIKGCFDESQLTIFQSQLIAYKNNLTLESDKYILLNAVLSANLSLKSDPYYIWKKMNAPIINCLDFYNIQTNVCLILSFMINIERNTVYRLFDFEYIKLLNLCSFSYNKYQISINNYNKSILESKGVNGKTNIEIAQTTILVSIYSNFYKNTTDENYKSCLFYVEKILENFRNFKVDIVFQFEELFKQATVTKRVVNLPPCTIDVLILKKMFLGVLGHAKNDILLIFPEIDVICDYINKNSFERFKSLHNNNLYTYLYVLNALSNVVYHEWFKIYFINEEKTKSLSYMHYIIYLASEFSNIKFEIFKLISYCMLPFIPDEFYTYYAQTRILERFYLSVCNSQFLSRNRHSFNAIHYVGRFNILTRFLFSSKINFKEILKCQMFLPDTELVILFLFKSCKLEEFCRFLSTENKSLLMFELLQEFFSIYDAKCDKNKAKDEYEKGETASKFPSIVKDSMCINIKKIMISNKVIKTVEVSSFNIKKILLFLLEFEECWLGKGYVKSSSIQKK